MNNFVVHPNFVFRNDEIYFVDEKELAEENGIEKDDYEVADPISNPDAFIGLNRDNKVHIFPRMVEYRNED